MSHFFVFVYAFAKGVLLLRILVSAALTSGSTILDLSLHFFLVLGVVLLGVHGLVPHFKHDLFSLFKTLLLV
jgi:hypothetical protein